MSQEMVSMKVGVKLDIEKYVEVFRDIKGSLNVLAMTLEGIANGMEAAEAQSDTGSAIGDRIRAAMESAAVKRYEAAAKLLIDLAEHFKPVALSDGSGAEYPAMTGDLMAKILAACSVQAEAKCECPDCPDCQEAEAAATARAANLAESMAGKDAIDMLIAAFDEEGKRRPDQGGSEAMGERIKKASEDGGIEGAKIVGTFVV
jgi:hypothetical protein